MKKINKKIVSICKKHPFLRKMLRKFRNTKSLIRYFIYKNTSKTNEKLIIFESFMGKKYACSPKAIYEEMINDEKYKDYQFIWAFSNPKSKRLLNNMDKAIIVKYKSKKFYKYCSQAKYIVTNSRFPDVVTFRKDQIYIQCWHGTPLKKLGYDIEKEGGNALNTLNDLQKKYKDDAKRFTYLLSPSKFTSEKLSTAFNLKVNNPKTEIIEEGYPRNDFLFKYTKNQINEIKAEIGIPKSNTKKIILYAPTWRDNQHTSGVGYTYDLGVDFDLLKKELSKDFIILFRPHYFVANEFDFDKYKGFIYDVSEYEDISELYTISDMLITDYSSVFFDYANLERPILFYMYDLKEYAEDIRGFYIKLEDLPGPIVEQEKELILEIKKLSINFKFENKYKKFNKKYNYLDDENSSRRVIDKIIK